MKEVMPRFRARIIPARAGFTTPHPRRIRRGGDHPRTRGVYPDDSSVAQRHAGSSPHARGLQAPAGPARRVHRIIPARAGFTAIVSQARFMCEDHPRTRGVYLRLITKPVRALGSSPHARGLLGDRPLRGGHPLDHPRTRGVYRSTVSVNLVHAGSSPHTRGLLSVSGISQGSSRIIPAHAGFTPS